MLLANSPAYFKVPQPLVPSSKSQSTCLEFPVPIISSRQCSASPGPPPYHLTTPTTVPLNYSLVHALPGVGSSPCLPPSVQLWIPTSRSPWQLASSVPQLPRLERASSLWGRTMGCLGHVSITGASTRSQFGIDTSFLSWPLLSSCYKGCPFLLNWIYAMLTISCGSGRGTNGRWPSTLPQATMSI